MSLVQHTTSREFSRAVFFSSTPVVVDIYADWCGPCRSMAPFLDRLAEHYRGRIKFLKINIDEEPEVAEVYRVANVPTLLFFKEGQLVDRVVGFSDPRQLIARLEDLAGARTANLV